MTVPNYLVDVKALYRIRVNCVIFHGSLIGIATGIIKPKMST